MTIKTKNITMEEIDHIQKAMKEQGLSNYLKEIRVMCHNDTDPSIPAPVVESSVNSLFYHDLLIDTVDYTPLKDLMGMDVELCCDEALLDMQCVRGDERRYFSIRLVRNRVIIEETNLAPNIVYSS